MVALNKKSGDLVWKCALPEDIGEGGSDGAGYSSIVARGDPRRAAIRAAARARPDRGCGPRTASSSGVTTGLPTPSPTSPARKCAGTTCSPTTRLPAPAPPWSGSPTKAMRGRPTRCISSHPGTSRNHHGGVVLKGDHIYGGHGPNRGDPACIEFATGKVVWKRAQPGPRLGSDSVCGRQRDLPL